MWPDEPATKQVSTEGWRQTIMSSKDRRVLLQKKGLMSPNPDQFQNVFEIVPELFVILREEIQN